MFVPGIVSKSIHGKKYMVLRWKKWQNGQSRVVKEIYIGDAERLAKILKNPGYDISVTSLSYGSTASILEMEKTVGIKGIVDGTVGHRGLCFAVCNEQVIGSKIKERHRRMDEKRLCIHNISKGIITGLLEHDGSIHDGSHQKNKGRDQGQAHIHGL